MNVTERFDDGSGGPDQKLRRGGSSRIRTNGLLRRSCGVSDAAICSSMGKKCIGSGICEKYCPEGDVISMVRK